MRKQEPPVGSLEIPYRNTIFAGYGAERFVSSDPVVNIVFIMR